MHYVSLSLVNYYYYHYHFTALWIFSWTTRVSWYQKVEGIWIYWSKR